MANTTRIETARDALDGTAFSLREKLALAFTALSLLAVVAVHVSWLPLTVQAAGHSLTNLIGQEHRWNMFAADPRGTSLDMWAVIEFEDGSTDTWRIERNVTGGDFRFYRWVQWMEAAVLLRPEEQIEGLAAWLAMSQTRPVQRVVVYGRQQPPAAPGHAELPPQTEVLVEFLPAGMTDG